jgi:hypothetical protein
MDEHTAPADQLAWARRAAARAARRGGYMATLLAEYQEMTGMDERQLAAELDCPPERLPLLGLCRAPSRLETRFAADVRALAAYGRANAGRLAQLIRAVDSARAFAGRTDEADAGYLAAARDAEDAPPAASAADTAEQGAGEPDEGPDGSVG